MDAQPDHSSQSTTPPPPLPAEASEHAPTPGGTPSRRYADGSRVLCADGRSLGEVVGTYREYLIVEKGAFFPTAMFVPFAAVAQAGAGDIVLSLTIQEAQDQDWHTIPEDPPMPEPEARPAPARVPPAPPRRPAAAPLSPPSGDFPPATTVSPASPAAAVSTTPVPPSPADPAPPRPAESAEPAPSAGAPDPTVATSTTTNAPMAPRPAPEAPSVQIPTAASAVPEDSIEVQAMEPDASVPPPVDPDVAASPTIGIPGRRLTDAELWSLLEPRAPGAAPDEGDAAEPVDEPSGAETPPKATS